ncbi:MAG: IclR family transcriptional regulator [Rhizobiales bacterium]|nr:IclR family transcriptional regulator [Hyphomicrobiales bacterium]
MKKSRLAGASAAAVAPVRQNPLDRYFSILEIVAAHPGLNATEVAELSGLPFPTAHRLLQGLRKAGLLNGGDRRTGHELGTRLLRLLQTGSDDSWIHITAQKKLDEVASDLSETCYLAKLVHNRVISVAWAAPANGLRGHVVPGLSQPLHAAACSKAILAHQSESFVRSILPNPLPKLAANTKTRLADVLAELELVRRQGFATCISENEPGITAIACPVEIHGTGVLYSIGVMILGDQLPEARLHVPTEVLKQAAAFLATSVSRQALT